MVLAGFIVRLRRIAKGWTEHEIYLVFTERFGAGLSSTHSGSGNRKRIFKSESHSGHENVGLKICFFAIVPFE